MKEKNIRDPLFVAFLYQNDCYPERYVFTDSPRLRELDEQYKQCQNMIANGYKNE